MLEPDDGSTVAKDLLAISIRLRAIMAAKAANFNFFITVRF
jgi:hypothetical protein